MSATERGLSAQTLVGLDLARSEHSPFHHRLVVRVMIRQRDDGGLLDATIVDPSGSAGFDKLALAQTRALARLELHKLGAPPREGRTTLWAFEADFNMVPPLPIAGCGFDAYFMPGECFWPGKRSVRSRIRLEAIY